jgi:hypothetical protein
VRSEYESNVGGTTMGVGHLNNNQVLVSLIDGRGRPLGKGKVSPFKVGLTPSHRHRRVSKPNPQLVRHVPIFFTLKPSLVRKPTVHTSLCMQGNTKMG